MPTNGNKFWYSINIALIHFVWYVYSSHKTDKLTD